MQDAIMPIEDRRLTIPDFKQLAETATAAGEFVGAVVIPKSLAFEIKAVDGQDRVREFKYSTADVDRDGDTLAVDGWELGNFNKAGAFLWAHSRSLPPIAKPLATWTEDGALKGKVEFPDQDMVHPLGKGFAFAVMQMYDGGFLRATSVGFTPIEWTVNEERAGFMPMDFKRQELVEVSAVPVPSNVNALHEARSKGIDTAPIVAWAETVRDDATGLWIPKGAVESLLEQAAGDKTISIPTTTADPEPDPDGNGNGGGPEPVAVSSSDDYASTMKAAELAEAEVISQVELAAKALEGRKIIAPENEARLIKALDKLLSLFPKPAQDDPTPIDPDDVEVIDDDHPPITEDQIRTLVAEVMDRHLSKLTGRLPV